MTTSTSLSSPTRVGVPLGVRLGALGAHGFLILGCLLALGPVVLIVFNSFKTQLAIFSSPFSLPSGDAFSLDGYLTVFTRGDFGTYYLNSTIVTVVSVGLVIVLSCLAGFGISEYLPRVSNVVLTIFVIGIMLPVRLGTVALLQMMSAWDLVNTLVPLILIYVSSSLPLAVVLMTAYMRSISSEIKEAARIDGAGEFRVFRLVAPLTVPGIAAVASVSMLPVWNDLWFPLIFAPGRATQTVTLGVQQFIGQFSNDWPALLAALTIGAIPLITLFVIFSRQFIAGMSQGSGR